MQNSWQANSHGSEEYKFDVRLKKHILLLTNEPPYNAGTGKDKGRHFYPRGKGLGIILNYRDPAFRESLRSLARNGNFQIEFGSDLFGEDEFITSQALIETSGRSCTNSRDENPQPEAYCRRLDRLKDTPAV